MIVRMFQKRFAPLVKSGRKKQTIRPWPKRLPRIGEEFSGREWIGKPYRSKQRELVKSVITRVGVFELTTNGSFKLDGVFLAGAGRKSIAELDGFKDAEDMEEWFREQHGLPFQGVIIHWR